MSSTSNVAVIDVNLHAGVSRHESLPLLGLKRAASRRTLRAPLGRPRLYHPSLLAPPSYTPTHPSKHTHTLSYLVVPCKLPEHSHCLVDVFVLHHTGGACGVQLIVGVDHQAVDAVSVVVVVMVWGVDSDWGKERTGMAGTSEAQDEYIIASKTGDQATHAHTSGREE